MSNSPTTHAGEPRQARRSRRFAFGLLVYLVLTVVSFVLVYRYTRQIAALYGYDIQNRWLQFGLYFGIFVAFTLVAHFAVARLPLHWSRENVLRLAFAAAFTLSTIVALYQSRFGLTVGVNYFAVGSLGAFVAALELTRRQFGLVEVISRPERDVVEAVRRGHDGLMLADGWWDRAKRLLELVLALALIVVSLPISVPLAVLLLLQDPGPLLVAKVAVKRGGESFHQLKLRTMVKNAERTSGPVPAAPEDARVTRLGGLLRRTHIDELPQMLNIARGDMSLVGPRPERTVFVQRHLQHIPLYRQRHAVRPGLAGLAQVRGDYYSTPREKLRYDLLYIRRRSFRLDAKLFTTAVLIALFGIRPARRRHQHGRHPQNNEAERWRRAYKALRGDEMTAEDGAPPGTPPVAGAGPAADSSSDTR